MNEYRLLKRGELIQPGDQFLADSGGQWVPAKCIGEEAPDPCYTSHRQYRRPVPLAQRVEPAMLVIAHWLISGKYRTVSHRHDGTYRAIDEASRQEWNSETLVELVDMMQRQTRMKNPAAVALGRLGGSANTPAQNAGPQAQREARRLAEGTQTKDIDNPPRKAVESRPGMSDAVARPKSTRIDLKCPCGEGWSGSVPDRHLAYVREEWEKKHADCGLSLFNRTDGIRH